MLEKKNCTLTHEYDRVLRTNLNINRMDIVQLYHKTRRLLVIKVSGNTLSLALIMLTSHYNSYPKYYTTQLATDFLAREFT